MFRNANIMRLDIFPISFLKQAYTFNRDKVNTKVGISILAFVPY